MPTQDAKESKVVPCKKGYAFLVDSEYSSCESYQSIGECESDERKGSILSSVFTLVSTMNGGGILSIPFAFHQGGFAVASAVLLVACVASAYSSFLIIRSKKYCMGRVKNIEDIGHVAFGRVGQVIAQVLLIAFCYLAIIAYLLLFTDQIKPLLSLVVGRNTMFTKKASLLTIAVIVIFPIALLKNLSALKYTSGFSMCCSLFVCACVAYRSITTDMGGPIKMARNPIKWYPDSFRGFLTCVAIIEVTFTCHHNVLPMHHELRKQTTSNKRIIIIISMALAYLTNFVISLFGYFQFREFTEEDITRNYGYHDIAVNCGRAALCCSLLLSTPLLVVPIRDTINKMIWFNELVPAKVLLSISNEEVDGPSRLMWFFETIVLVGSTYILANFTPKISIVWGFVGAVGSTSLVYILPPAFYVRVRDPRKGGCFKLACAYIMLTIGFMLLIVGLYEGTANIITPLQRTHLLSFNISLATSFKANSTI